MLHVHAIFERCQLVIHKESSLFYQLAYFNISRLTCGFLSANCNWLITETKLSLFLINEFSIKQFRTLRTRLVPEKDIPVLAQYARSNFVFLKPFVDLFQRVGCIACHRSQTGTVRDQYTRYVVKAFCKVFWALIDVCGSLDLSIVLWRSTFESMVRRRRKVSEAQVKVVHQQR